MFDALVVGAGMAGLTAAVRLAEGGRTVLLVAKGAGSTHLTGGTIDVLGYAPERVDNPRRALSEFVARNPEHPYGRLPVEAVEAALDWFREELPDLGYAGGLDENLLLPSAAGAIRPTALAPASMAGGDLHAQPRLLIAGFRAFKDFHPAYVADNLAAAGLAARATLLDVSPRPGEADVAGLVFASGLDGDADFRRRLAEELAAHVQPGEAVGLPAVLGITNPADTWRELQERIGAAVFEIPTLPPSAPGLRVHRRLDAAFRHAGGRLIVGSAAVGAQTSNGRVDAVVVEDAVRRRAYRARAFVLATGGFAAGGLELEPSGTLREPVLGLPVAGVPAESPRLGARYLDPHPLSRAGLAVDEELRPVGPDGRPVYENVHAAGAMLAGGEPWREKSGDGISVASGFRAAQAIERRLAA